MEAGEIETRKAFEQVTRGNVRAAVDFGNETRTLVREMHEKLSHMEKIVQEQNQKIAEVTQQLSILQGKFYQYGSE